MEGPQQLVAWPGVAPLLSRALLAHRPARVIYMCAYLVETASPDGLDTCPPVERFPKSGVEGWGTCPATATGLSAPQDECPDCGRKRRQV